MIEILTQRHKYVPQSTYFIEKAVSTVEVEKIEKAKMRQILVGGDQLTAARAWCAINGKMNAQTPEKSLGGIIPVIEDWHTKANFLGVSYMYVCSIIQHKINSLLNLYFVLFRPTKTLSYSIIISVMIHLFCSGDMEVLLFIKVSISIWYYVPTEKSYGKD